MALWIFFYQESNLSIQFRLKLISMFAWWRRSSTNEILIVHSTHNQTRAVCEKKISTSATLRSVNVIIKKSKKNMEFIIIIELTCRQNELNKSFNLFFFSFVWTTGVLLISFAINCLNILIVLFLYFHLVMLLRWTLVKLLFICVDQIEQ